MKVVYIDILFLINFIVDYLLLSLTAYLRGNNARNFRITFSATIGGLLSIGLFFAPSVGVAALFVKILCCCLSSYIAFGFANCRRFIGDCAMLCAASFIFSGAIIAVSQIYPNRGAVNNTSIYFDISLKNLIIGTAVGYFIMSCFCRGGSYKQEKKIMSIKCSVRGADLSFNAFVDTGNMLTEPISGKKIIIVSPSVISSALEGAESKVISSLHKNTPVVDAFEQLALINPSCYGLIPFTSAGGKGLIITVKPDNLTVNGKPDSDYILGVGIDEIETVCGCRAIIGC